MRPIKLTPGAEYHGWKVIRELEERYRGAVRYECECLRCGRVKPLTGSDVAKGKSRHCKSCGASIRSLGKTGEAANGWKGCGRIPGGHWSRIKRVAAKRKLAFEVSIEEAWDIYLQQAGKCPLTGLRIEFVYGPGANTASLDRIDSSLGYIPGNVRWVHKTVNVMRSNMTDEVFLSWCRLVVTHNATSQQGEYLAAA